MLLDTYIYTAIYMYMHSSASNFRHKQYHLCQPEWSTEECVRGNDVIEVGRVNDVIEVGGRLEEFRASGSQTYTIVLEVESYI